MTDTSKGYGTASYSGASSDNPGSRTRAPLTVNHDDSDPKLSEIRANGAKHRDDPSVFVGRGNKPTPKVAQGNKASTPADTPQVPGYGRPPVKKI